MNRMGKSFMCLAAVAMVAGLGALQADAGDVIFATGFGSGPAGDGFLYKYAQSNGALIASTNTGGGKGGASGVGMGSDGMVYVSTGSTVGAGAFDGAIVKFDPVSLARTVWISSLSAAMDKNNPGVTVGGNPFGFHGGSNNGQSFLNNSFFGGAGLVEINYNGGSPTGTGWTPAQGVGGEGGNLNTPLDGPAGVTPFRNPGDPNVYYSSHGATAGEVRAFDSSGTLVATIGAGQPGIAESRFGPDYNGDNINDLYVGDRHGSGYIRVFSGAAGFAMLDSNAYARPAGDTWKPTSLAFAPDGALWVGDNPNDQLWRSTLGGATVPMGSHDAALGLTFATIIPEPSSIILLIVGLMGLGYWSWKRK